MMEDEAPVDTDSEPEEGDEEPAPSEADDPETPDEEPGPSDSDAEDSTVEHEADSDAEDSTVEHEADSDAGVDEPEGSGDADGTADGEPESTLPGADERTPDEHESAPASGDEDESAPASGDEDEPAPDAALDTPAIETDEVEADSDADSHPPPDDYNPGAHWPEETQPDVEEDQYELTSVEDGEGTLVDEDGETEPIGAEPHATSDGGYADEFGGTGTGTGVGAGAGGAVHEGAPDDEEMPLADHIEEMIKRLGVVVVVMAVVSGVVFPFGEELINFLWYSFLPGSLSDCPQNLETAACPRVYQPLALVLARLKVATLVGFIVALPVFVYETYLFMRPGLYPKERRYYLASVPTSLVLAAIGVAFAYFLVLPTIFTYFVFYSEGVTVIAFGLTETFDLMVLLMGFFAIVFQIPLFVMLAIMMGLTSRQWLADRRIYFWGAFLGIAFLFSPDPTGMAPIIVAATMVALFEATLLLLKWTKRG